MFCKIQNKSSITLPHNANLVKERICYHFLQNVSLRVTHTPRLGFSIDILFR